MKHPHKADMFEVRIQSGNRTLAIFRHNLNSGFSFQKRREFLRAEINDVFSFILNFRGSFRNAKTGN